MHDRRPAQTTRLILRALHQTGQRAVLYVAVPERFQGPDRPFDGFLIRDDCEAGDAPVCLQCLGARGQAADGTYCSCVCTTGDCPAVRCVECR